MVSSSRRERSGAVPALAVLPLLLLLIVPASAHSLREVVPTQVRAQLGSKRTEWHDLSGRHCPLFAHGTSAAFPMPASHTARSANSNSPFKLQLAFDAGRVVTPWVSAPLDGSSSPSLAVTLSYSGDALTSASVEPEESVPSTSFGSNSLAVVRYYWYRDAEYDGSLASVCVAAGCGAVAAVLIARALRGVRLDQALLLLLNPAAPGTGTSPSVEQ
jgi:hypothetical protein